MIEEIHTGDQGDDRASPDHMTESMKDDKPVFHVEQPATPSLSFDVHTKVHTYAYVCIGYNV